MVRNASLFSQVLSIVDRRHFAATVEGFGAEKAAKGFRCWNQFGGEFGSTLHNKLYKGLVRLIRARQGAGKS